MDHPAVTVPEPRYRLAEGVLFQPLAHESVLLHLKTELYFGLDPVGTRMWHLLTTTHTVAATVAAMRADYEVTEAKLQQDVSALAERLVAKGLLVVDQSLTNVPRV